MFQDPFEDSSNVSSLAFFRSPRLHKKWISGKATRQSRAEYFATNLEVTRWKWKETSKWSARTFARQKGSWTFAHCFKPLTRTVTLMPWWGTYAGHCDTPGGRPYAWNGSCRQQAARSKLQAPAPKPQDGCYALWWRCYRTDSTPLYNKHRKIFHNQCPIFQVVMHINRLYARVLLLSRVKLAKEPCYKFIGGSCCMWAAYLRLVTPCLSLTRAIN